MLNELLFNDITILTLTICMLIAMAFEGLSTATDRFLTSNKREKNAEQQKKGRKDNEKI